MNKKKYLSFFRKKLFNFSFFLIRYKSIKYNFIKKLRISCEKKKCRAIFTKNSLLNIYLRKKKINYVSKYNNFILLVNNFFDFKKTVYLNLPKKKIETLLFYQNKEIIFKKSIKNLLKKKSKKKALLSLFLNFKKRISLFLNLMSFLKNENQRYI
ncbi:50S ribosomal subunit protein L10 [Candidatus Vidania fulgoroideae]|nr:50S ribosomal subunit protein L10 [Candidatus Vidania fulgoroideae]